MEIIIAKNIGFCFGVMRAITEAKKEIDENTYFLGDLIHNKNVIDKISGKVVNSIDEIPDKAKVIIRTHGVSKNIIKEANEKKLTIVDLTCPKVVKVHKLVSERKNNLIVIIGKKNHPEIIGTVSYANEYIVIEDENDLVELTKLLETNKKKISVFSQTTISNLEFVSMVNKIKRIAKTYIEIIPCICPVVEERQKEVCTLASTCDLVIIVGDLNSSNTKKLYESSISIKDTIWIQNKDELDFDKIKDYKKVGIISGTSTDIEVVNLLISELKNKFQ